jgi:hypothetical protein
LNPRFRPGATADQSAVTFTPYFLTEQDGDILCLQEREFTSLLVVAMDTAGTAPGLAADFPRAYEMRGAASVYAGPAAGVERFPVRTFGQVTVGVSTPDVSRRNAAGYVFMVVDTLSCVRIQPLGTYQPGTALPLDSQTDTAGVSGAFVRGYIYEPAAPVCGETKVFHLVARN